MRRTLFLLSASIVTAASASAQSLSLKPGLWESRTVDDDGSITKSRECVTAEQLKLPPGGASRPNCQSNVVTPTPNQVVYDMSCTSPRGTTRVHAQRDAIDPEHMRVVITTNSTLGGKQQTSTSKSEAHFISAACGAIKPGDPQEVE